MDVGSGERPYTFSRARGTLRARRRTVNATHHALIVSATFHGTVIEERHERSVGPVEIGHSERLSLPLPEGVPYLARVLWTSPVRCVVKDGLGQQHLLEPGGEVLVEMGPVSVRIYLAPQFSIRRVEGLTLQASLAWFTVVLMATVASMQGGWWQDPQNHCPWAMVTLPTVPDVRELALWVLGPGVAVALLLFIVARQAWRELPTWIAAAAALLVPLTYTLTGIEGRTGEDVLQSSFYYCFESDDEGAGGGSPLTAEYLHRLLAKDYDGDENGALEMKERPDADKKAERVYLPAGNKGPITEMGGAADTSRKPVRAPEVEDEPLPTPKKEESKPLFAKDVGEPMAETPPDEQDATDGVVELDVDPPKEEEADSDLPAEEQEGWGIQDWYDEQDKAMEQLEIDYMMKVANRRLKIDPDDAQALSILSYYQYLAADYDDAIDTYDHFIELYPDDAAGYNNKALVYKRLGDYDKEEALYRVALAIEPNDVTAINNLAVNLAHQGRYDEALSWMEQLEQLDPDDPYADLHRSKIHAEIGDDDKALFYLDKALQGMKELDTLHHIEFRQDIRVDPSFERLRQSARFRGILVKYYGKDTPLQE